MQSSAHGDRRHPQKTVNNGATSVSVVEITVSDTLLDADDDADDSPVSD